MINVDVVLGESQRTLLSQMTMARTTITIIITITTTTTTITMETMAMVLAAIITATVSK